MSRNYKSNKQSNNKGKFRTKDSFSSKSKGKDSAYTDKPTNNPSWYMTNNAIVEGVANLPFNMPIGSPFDVINKATWNDEIVFKDHYTPSVAVPGVAVFDVVPSFGIQMDSSSSLNISAQAIYTWVRYYNSGARNYTPADLLIYLAANSQVYSMINWAMRIYGTISQYDHRNKYLGAALIHAMGIDYKDFIGRMAEYRGRLNLLINKAAAFVVPNTMTYFLRTASLFTDIYTDGSSIKDQLYVLNPVGFYRYTFDRSDSPRHDGAYLKFHTLTTDDHLMTVDDVIAYLDDSISALINSHDQAVISGDLYKAYQGNILTLAELGENYRTNIVNDPWVLNQIKNSTITSFWNYPDLWQDPEEGNVIFDTTVSVHVEDPSDEDQMNKMLQFLGMDGNRVLTVPTENVDTAQVMEYTRYMTIPYDYDILLDDDSSAQTITAKLLTGSEIILRSKFIFASPLHFGDRTVDVGVARFWHYIRLYSADNLAENLLFDTLKRYFKYFPATIKASKASSGAICISGFDLDIDNYTLIDESELRHLHDVALMNMLATDAVAKLK